MQYQEQNRYEHQHFNTKSLKTLNKQFTSKSYQFFPGTYDSHILNYWFTIHVVVKLFTFLRGFIQPIEYYTHQVSDANVRKSAAAWDNLFL